MSKNLPILSFGKFYILFVYKELFLAEKKTFLDWETEEKDLHYNSIFPRITEKIKAPFHKGSAKEWKFFVSFILMVMFLFVFGTPFKSIGKQSTDLFYKIITDEQFFLVSYVFLIYWFNISVLILH